MLIDGNKKRMDLVVIGFGFVRIRKGSKTKNHDKVKKMEVFLGKYFFFLFLYFFVKKPSLP